ncbi:MAG: LytTR family DNA-binding domain-containing protein [Candidatus Limiplasma sp.]|nr:LytTR family DNA-binding domain-containing protein [Candidatus Limiplasma sp.]
MPMRIAVCEDNPADLDCLLRAIESSGHLAQTDSFPDGPALTGRFAKGLYDIVFLDIYMPGQSGMDTARAIRAADPRTTIVFVTSSGDHTREAYQLEALKYIEKPFEPGAVKAALDLAWGLRQSLKLRALPTKQGTVELFLEDIYYIEVLGHSCILHLEKEKVQTPLGIESLAALLPSPNFLRCHRSFIVNLAHVQGMDRDFLMTNGDRVYIRGKDEKKMAAALARFLAAKTRGIDHEG